MTITSADITEAHNNLIARGYSTKLAVLSEFKCDLCNEYVYNSPSVEIRINDIIFVLCEKCMKEHLANIVSAINL